MAWPSGSCFAPDGGPNWVAVIGANGATTRGYHVYSLLGLRFVEQVLLFQFGRRLGQVFNFQAVIVVSPFAFQEDSLGNLFEFQMRIVFRLATKC